MKTKSWRHRSSQLEYDLQLAQEEVTATQTHEQYVYRQLYDDEGDPRFDVNTGEPLMGKYSNEITIRAPASGRVMAIYIEAGDDSLAVYRDKGAVMVLSTDGRMKVNLSGLEGQSLELGDTVRVLGDGVDHGGHPHQPHAQGHGGDGSGDRRRI